jgi:hypothetical protein
MTVSLFINPLALLTIKGGSGGAVTTIVTEYRLKRPTDDAAFMVEVERLGTQETEDLLRQSVQDYRRYHLLSPNNEEGLSAADIESMRVKAGLGWNTLGAAFSDRPECTEGWLRDPNTLNEDIIQSVFRWRDQITWPAGFGADLTTSFTFDNVDRCRARLEGIARDGRIWLFVKVIR